MNTHVTKNYNTDGGNRTVIGGVLEFTESSKIEGFPGVENQAASTATQVGALKEDFNALLVKLKEAGLMEPDGWHITAGLAPSPTDQTVAGNNAKAAVSLTDNVITITADLRELSESASSVPSQGTHKWLCLEIGTGLASITSVKYNGEALTNDDVSEADACGCNTGAFVLYIKAEAVAEEGKQFTLKADGYTETTVSVVIVSPDTD